MGQINKIGVIGAGNMGSGIAQKIAQEGISVVMIDIEEHYVQRGLETIKATLEEGVTRGIFKPQQVDDTMARIQATTDLNAVADADLVVEAVFEDKAVKADLFKRLDKACGEKTILATNTSSFYVREFAEMTSRPDRFVGLHYFYHPAKNRLLEVIPHASTSDETVEKSLLMAKLHGKTAILVKDAPGFAVNRFFVPFLNEAARLLEEGVADIPTIEAAAQKAFKIGMGPFLLMNVTGIPIAVHAATTLGKELGPFYAPCELLKTQKETNNPWDLEGEPDESRFEAVIDRLYGVCLGVAAALVDEGVASLEDTDRGAKIGLRWLLGPFEIMNRIGIDRTVDLVQGIADRYPDFNMPALLTEQKSAGTPFQFRWVDLNVKNGIAYLTINRPEAMNALNVAVADQLKENLESALERPDVKAIVINGAGKAFVAGADIRFFVQNIKKDDLDAIVDFTRDGHELLLQIENCPKPTIAILDGLSLGGGSELALACQAIVATPAGSMAFPETGIGIFPGLGGMLRLSRQVGPELARYYAFTGAPITATDAQALGITSGVTAPADIEKAIQEMIQTGLPDKYRPRDLPQRFADLAALCSPENVNRLLEGQTPEGVDAALAAKAQKIMGYKAPLALKMADQIIEQQNGKSIAEGVEIELARLKEIFATADALEGLSSAGRRRPTYQGR